MARIVTLGSRSFDLDSRPILMGVLNVTPDSFSDGGDYLATDNAVEQALKMEEDGAGIIDIGGESTRPGAAEVEASEEIDRVVPVIKALRRHSSIPVSIDTRKASVFAAAIEAGADILNDISGLTHDREMVHVLQRMQVPVIIMHMQGSPETMQQNPAYDDVIAEIKAFLGKQADVASEAGAPEVFIDPGIGFGKRIEHNLSIIRNLAEFREIGYPVALGPSRKSFIGKLLDLPVEERLEGTLAAAAIATFNGADLMRLHDVRAGRRAIDMACHIRGNM